MTLRWPGERRLYASALLIYALLRVGFAGFHPATYTDTADYERTASAPIWSVHFLAGIRGFTLPLIYKILPNDSARIGFQLAFSIFAWSVLALVLSRSLRTERGRFVGFALVLLLSLTRYVIGWDPLLLSESISNSLFALLVAAILVVVRRPGWRPVIALSVAALAWAFVRDSNGVVVLVGGVIALVRAVRPRHRLLALAIGGAAIAIFLGSAVTADVGKRWVAPFGDILVRRLPEQPALRNYVRVHGGEKLPGERRARIVYDGEELSRERRAYLVYIATHPVYALVDPFVGDQHAPLSSVSKAGSLLNPQVDQHVATLNSAARPVRSFFDVLWIHSLAGVLAFAGFAVGAAALSLRRQSTPLGWVAIGVLLSAYPAALAAWHLSGVELDRHALGAALALRLGAYLLAAYALDSFLVHREVLASHASQASWASNRHEPAPLSQPRA